MEEVKPQIEKGVAALKQLGSFKPFLAGAELTYADIYAYYTFPFANMVTQKLYNWDIVAAIPGLKEALAGVGARAGAKKADADHQAAMAAFAAQNKG